MCGLKRLNTIELEGNNLRKLDEFVKIKEYFFPLWMIRLNGNPLNSEWLVSAMEVCIEKHIECCGISKDCISIAVKRNETNQLLFCFNYFYSVYLILFETQK